MTNQTKKRLINLGLIFGTFTLLSLFFSSDTYFVYMAKGIPINFWERLYWNTIKWLPWAALTPFIVYLARRCTIEHQNYRRTLPIHLLAGILFSVTHSMMYIGLYWMSCMFAKLSYQANFFSIAVKFIHFDILTYGVIIGITYMFDYYRSSRERELRASQLEARLAQAQLEVLKMQLHPHFLFNTLHAISALIPKDTEAADKMISRLSDLLRLTLENSNSQEVPLREELEFLKIYMDIEQTRFRDRLKINLNIRPETLDALVPNLILQPLVENAVRHGIAPRKEGGKIEIRSMLVDKRLSIQVVDDGAGITEDSDSLMRKGFGLSNTRERLNQLYGDKHSFNLTNADEGGAIVTIDIPFRKSEETSTGERIEE
jgi:sensor histidine kinase YesM